MDLGRTQPYYWLPSSRNNFNKFKYLPNKVRPHGRSANGVIRPGIAKYFKLADDDRLLAGVSRAPVSLYL